MTPKILNSQFSILNSRTGWQPVLLDAPLVERAARAFAESSGARTPAATERGPPAGGIRRLAAIPAPIVLFSYSS